MIRFSSHELLILIYSIIKIYRNLNEISSKHCKIFNIKWCSINLKSTFFRMIIAFTIYIKLYIY
jgi:hypothetical protein